MPKPRKRQVSLSDTPYYHCISRCVRRAFLCGLDPVTGFDFSHRRGWIVARMQELATVFAIDLCAYAVLSDHYHVVIRINADQARHWSEREVAERWLQLFKGPELGQRWLGGKQLDQAERERLSIYIDIWRQRLCDLSWYMRCLNESIARIANQEDRCSGRFWEGRFKSQALLDERALLVCMAYVDLNPIRAGLARSPEHSSFTSIKERIEDPQTALRRFSGHSDDADGIPFSFQGYLQLVDWSGRAIRSDKKGYIPANMPPILARLGMQPAALLDYLGRKPDRFVSAVGPIALLRAMAQSLGMSFLRGVQFNRQLCGE